jgi:alpha-L-fucosidase 2
MRSRFLHVPVVRFTVVVWCCLSTLLLSAQPPSLRWEFPLLRPHAGMLLGNGVQGLLVWGREGQLNITIGRAGFWDRRGGNAFSTRTTFQDVRRMLEAKDETGLKKAFEVADKADKGLNHPQQLGGGRLELTLPAGWLFRYGDLNTSTGTMVLTVQNPAGQTHQLSLSQAVGEEIAWIKLPRALRGLVKAQLVPAFAAPAVGPILAAAGIAAPQTGILPGTAINAPLHFFTQTLPQDAPLSVAFRVEKGLILLGSALGDADRNVKILQEKMTAARVAELAKGAALWWQQYWATVPAIALPDPTLQEIVTYGLYKQACCTPPQGLPCALQGPFMEDYQLPPWSNDFHFNINIQMIYQPALATNRLDHLKPMWAMMLDWMPQLRQNGEQFFGRPGALMLPHAVDDRCQVVGTFWTGTIDHACMAWMAHLAWQHFLYSQDETVLTNIAYPLLEGAFEGYWAMLEPVPDGRGGKRLSLPVSVSPEYGGAAMSAWGSDASFQLAALHAIAADLPKAAARLKKTADPRWAEVTARVPPYTLVNERRYEADGWFNFMLRQPHIALWEGKDLNESHRHHSHLAAIYPFCTIDPLDAAHQKVVETSVRHWTHLGMGAWSGWCIPWASTIHSRVGNTEAAVSLLHYWRQNFVNEGRGTLHNANAPGLSAIASPVYAKATPEKRNDEIMQLDAGFGALTAVLELLVQNRADGIHVFPNLHHAWRQASFQNIRTEGAFLVSARVENGRMASITVNSTAGGRLRLVHNLGETFRVNGKLQTGLRFEKDCTPGETITLTRS